MVLRLPQAKITVRVHAHHCRFFCIVKLKKKKKKKKKGKTQATVVSDTSCNF